MWKYGGVYSDLDTITLKSFEPLIAQGKNGIGDMFENFADIGNGVMVFQPKLDYIHYLMEKFANNYKSNNWSSNGPILLVQTLLDYCDIDEIHRHLLPGYKRPKEKTLHLTRRPKPKHRTPVYSDKKHKCANLTIFPQSYFYPILYEYFDALKDAFVENSTFDELYWKAIENSYSIHFYGKLTSLDVTKPSDKSFYGELASLYCDFTYNYVKENNLFFDSV